MGRHLIAMQHKVLEEECGIEHVFGCAQLDRIVVEFGDDREVLEASFGFMRGAQTAYVDVVEAVAPPRSRLLKSGPIARETVLEFFDVCNAKMNTMRFRDALNAHWRATKTPPNQLIIDAQRGVLEALGVEKEHGCQRLSGIQRDFPNDQEVHTKMQIWMHTAQETCHQIVNDDTDGMQMYLMKNQHMREQHAARQAAAANGGASAQPAARARRPAARAFRGWPTRGSRPSCSRRARSSRRWASRSARWSSTRA